MPSTLVAPSSPPHLPEYPPAALPFLRTGPRKIEGLRSWSEREIKIQDDEGQFAPLVWWPWQREIVDALDPSNEDVAQVTLKMFGQGGKSLMLGALMSHVACESHIPSMFVMPTASMRKRFVKDKLEPMLEACPALKRNIKLTRNGLFHQEGLMYQHGYIPWATARAVSSMKSTPAKLVIADEIDDFPPKADAANPLDLLLQRGQRFTNPKVDLASTPSLEGSSLIDGQYLLSDMREYYMPCVHCTELTRFLWDNVSEELSDELSELAGKETWAYHLHCESCAANIEEDERMHMLWDERGMWIPGNKSVNDHRGYWVNQFYSYTTPFAKTMEGYNRKAPSGFYTQRLAMAYKQEEYEPITQEDIDRWRGIPKPEGRPFARTCGVDNQHDRIEFTVIEWHGPDWYDLSPYIEGHYIMMHNRGDAKPTYHELRGVMRKLRIDVMFIDTGLGLGDNRVKGLTRSAFGSSFSGRRVVCIKGRGTGTISEWGKKPWIANNTTLSTRREADKVLVLEVDIIKKYLMDDLKADRVAINADTSQFPDDYGAQLSSETLVRLPAPGGVERLRWKKVRARNEAFDCAVYAYAAMQYLGPDYKPRTSRFELHPALQAQMQ